MTTATTASTGPTARAPRTRRLLVWLIIGTAIAMLAGHAVPPLTINLMKMLDTDETATYATAPAPAQVLDFQALSAGDPTAQNVGRAECAAGGRVPLDCFQVAGDGSIERHTRTSATDKFIEAEVDSLVTVLIDGEVVATLDDHSRVSRDSNFPVPEPRAHTDLALPRLDAELAGADQVREGLQYFFPFNTERRSYLYFDPLAQKSVPIDYVGEIETSGLEAWEFSHTLEPVNLFGAAARATGADTVGWTDISPLPLAEAVGTTLEPYYTVDRTVFVEPETGTVLDVHETHHVLLAADDREAADLAARTAEAQAPHPELSIYYSEANWDEATQDQQAAAARPDLAWLRALQILSWVANAVALALVAAIVVLIVRARDARSRALTAAEA